MGGHGGHGTVDVLRKAGLLLVLTFAMLGIHQFAIPPEGFEVRGLFALGYIVLAAYTVGELAEVIRLPHITGYLLTGLVLGPSAAHLLEPLHLPAPLDVGVLNPSVIGQLSLIDGLALALIALTAGGELDLKAMRAALRPIAAVLLGQVAFVGLLVGGFAAAAAAVWPQLFPGLPADPSAPLAVGALLATVGLATSPAATIAVINGAGAKGPLSQIVLSVVVLTEVVVVALFAVAVSFAAPALGGAAATGLGAAALHLAYSALLGLALAGLVHLYLRFVASEVMLFVVAAIYTTSFTATTIHADATLAFIVAGVVLGNFSPYGGKLIHEVERLALPVNVVFFTLAGAKLHLAELLTIFPLVAGITASRAVAVFAGSKVGGRLGAAPDVVQRYTWMGLISQAGLAIGFATQLQKALPGELGTTLFSLLIGCVAVNELAGPILLKSALTAAQEVGKRDAAADAPATADAPPRAATAIDLDLADPFGPDLRTGVDELDRAVANLQVDLQAMVRERTWAPMTELRRDAESWLKLLRRDLLRVHRAAVGKVATAASDAELATALRYQVGELSDRWRAHVLALAARLPRADRWSPSELLDGLDAHIGSLPAAMSSPILVSSLTARDEGRWRQWRRSGLRLRARLGARRDVNLRDIARFHLGGTVPSRLEGVAALMVESELTVAKQVQALFERIAGSWEDAARHAEAGVPRDEVRGALERSHADADAWLDEIGAQLEAVAKEGVSRTAAIVGWGVRRIKEDVAVIGTFELPYRKRRFTHVFALRTRGVVALGPGLIEARRLVAARYGQLALELELVGLEGRAQDAVQAHATELERMVRGRGPKQLQLVEQALGEWVKRMNHVLDRAEEPGPLAKLLRAETEPVSRRIQDARRAIEQLHQELSEEAWLAPLLDRLHGHVHGLTDVYVVPSRPVESGGWHLPSSVPTTEIPFQELAVGAIDAGITRALIDLTTDLASHVRAFQAHLDELERVLVFNVDLALAELDVADEEAALANETRELIRAMVVGAVGRSHARFARHTESSVQTADDVRERVQSAVIGRFQRMHRLVVEGQLGQLRLEVLRDAAARRGLVERAGQWAQLPDFGGAARHASERLLGATRLEALREAVGLPDGRAGTELAAVLASPPVVSTIPVVYRRLFSDQALEGADLLSGRHEALAAVKRVITDGDRRLRSVAVVSVDPHAARALVNTALRSHAGAVVRLQADSPLSDHDIEAFLAELPTRDVSIVIEDLPWLFTRGPAGTRGVERLARAVVADAGRRSWIFLADPAVWAWISDATSLDESTGEVLHLRPLSSVDLQAAVLARHTMSGYDVSFGDPDEVPWLSRLLRRRERGQRARQEWFDHLFEASAGVLQDALRLWMASIDRVDEVSGAIHVGPIRRPPVAALAALPDETLLTLLQVLQQGWIDAEQHAWLFRVDRSLAEAQLAQLAHQGLLVERGARFLVQPHLRGALDRALRSRGWAA